MDLFENKGPAKLVKKIWHLYSLILLQIIHLILLLLIPVSYTAFNLTIVTHNDDTRLIGIAVLVAGVLWTSFIVVYTVIFGDRDAAIKSLINTYRSLLNRRHFLIISILIFALLESILIHQLLFFRSITFLSETDKKVVLYLTDIPGHQKKLGDLKANSSVSIRLKVGIRHVAYTTNENDNVGALAPINVPTWWSGDEPPTVKIKKGEGNELLR